MTRSTLRWGLLSRLPLVTLSGISLLLAMSLRADQVELQNGDRLVGQVLSLSRDELVLKSEALGTLRVPRAKVTAITFGGAKAPNPVVAAPAAKPSARPAALAAPKQSEELSAMLRQLAANSNLVQKVQSQVLSQAGPEANDKFSQMLGQLYSGKLDLNDIRLQAKSAADQLRSARKELGEEGWSLMDGYLTILDRFLKETTPSGTTTTNAALPTKPGKGILELEEE